MVVWQIEGYIGTVLFLATALLELFALSDAVFRPAAAYHAADRLSKPAWLLFLFLSLLFCAAFESALGLFGLLGLVVAGVYLVDVRPALKEVTGR